MKMQKAIQEIIEKEMQELKNRMQQFIGRGRWSADELRDVMQV